MIHAYTHTHMHTHVCTVTNHSAHTHISTVTYYYHYGVLLVLTIGYPDYKVIRGCFLFVWSGGRCGQVESANIVAHSVGDNNYYFRRGYFSSSMLSLGVI